jgi:putative redox protein
MGTQTAKVDWKGGIKFEGTSAFGHPLVMDGAIKAGGEESGYKPNELLLFAVAGCTGIDVVRILQKQRQKLASLEIEVIAHQSDEYPKPFHTVEVKYTAKGENLDEKKLARAVELSEEKYCVVSQTLCAETKIVTRYEVTGV